MIKGIGLFMMPVSQKKAIKKAFVSKGFSLPFEKKEVLSFFLILVLEFFHAACGVDKQLFAGEKWMRSRAHFDLDNRVFLTIFHFDGFFGIGSRAAYKFGVAGSVPENNFSVLRMNAFFHINYAFFPLKRTANIRG